MVIVLALTLTLVLAGIGMACVRAYVLTRPGALGSGPGAPTGRGYASGGLYEALGRPATPLFGGRRWAVVGCYSALLVIIAGLIVLDCVLLFALSVAHSS